MTGFQGKNVWIVGASSGIGHALALELSGRGATLALSARDEGKLQSLNVLAGGRHHVVPLDVTDAAAVERAAAHVFSLFSCLDSVIFMAGTYQPMRIDAMDMAASGGIVATNLTGALNLLHAVLPGLQRQKSGQIALCASVAGYRGLPNAQPYGATKAALINLAESLKLEVRGSGIDVRIINPGFVATPMTAKNRFAMPMIITPEKAARALAGGLLGRGFEIHFPRRFTWLMKILGILPAWIYFRVIPR